MPTEWQKIQALFLLRKATANLGGQTLGRETGQDENYSKTGQ